MLTVILGYSGPWKLLPQSITGPVLADRRLGDAPEKVHQVHDLFSADELAHIDSEVLECLANLNARLLKAHDREPTRGGRIKLGLLFTGLQNAAVEAAQAVKLMRAIERMGAKEITFVGSAAKCEAMKESLQGLPELDVKNGALHRTNLIPGNLRERMYRRIADNYWIALAISIFLETLHRLRYGTEKADRSRKDDPRWLFEASGRLTPYIFALRDGALPVSTTFFGRRRMAIHLKVLRAKHPQFRPLYLSHMAIHPRVVFPFIRYVGSVGPKRLKSVAQSLGSGSSDYDPRIETIIVNLSSRGGSERLTDYLSAEKLITTLRPDLLVQQADNAPFERSMILATRRANCPNAAIQHGAFTEPMNLDGFSTDRYHVWGQGSADFLRRWKRMDTAIKIVGQSIYYEVAKGAQNQIQHRDRPRILYATRANSEETATYYPDREEDFMTAIRQAWPKRRPLELVIKPHPRANPYSWYEAEAAKFSQATGASVTVTRRPLLDELDDADLVLSTGGTTVLEAVSKKRTCLYILPPSRKDTVGWTQFSCLHVVQLADVNRLSELLSDPIAAHLDFETRAMMTERERFLNYFIAYDDLLSPKRVIDDLADWAKARNWEP